MQCRVGAGPFRLVTAGIDRVELAAAASAEPQPTISGIVFLISPDSVSRALGLARAASTWCRTRRGRPAAGSSTPAST
jgi:hypothetical protein